MVNLKTCIISVFKSEIFWVIINFLFLLLINVSINILIAKGYNYILVFFKLNSYYYYFIILILFLYNYLLIRHIAISWIYEWQFPFQFFSIYKEAQRRISILKANVYNFIQIIECLLDEEAELTKNVIDYANDFFYYFEIEYSVYNTLNNKSKENNNLIKYKISKNQKKYFELLEMINNVLNDDIIKNDIMNLKNNVIDHLPENGLKMNSNNINQNFEKKKLLAKLLMYLKSYKKIIDKYDIENYTYLSPFYLYNLFTNDTFGSLYIYNILFKMKFDEKVIIEEHYTSKKVQYNIIKNPKNNEKETNLLIFCLPNGGCFQLLPKMKIDFYLENNFTFLCWNYRGFGFSKGTASFTKCKNDVLEIYDTVVGNPKNKYNKICVMGHSIGGVAACYLAKKRKIDLLISDRNFCDLNHLARNFYFGKLLSFFVSFLLIKGTENISNFMSYLDNKIDEFDENGLFEDDSNNIKKNEKNKLNRIIMYSPIDTLILNDATVKSGVSRYVIKNYIKLIIHDDNDNIKTIQNKENFLELVFNDKNSHQNFVHDFLELTNIYYGKHELIINIVHRGSLKSNINTENNENNSDILNNEKKNLIITEPSKNTDIDKILFWFFDKFFGVFCDNLTYIENPKISFRRKAIFLESFFNNLLIWGAQGGKGTVEYYEFYPKQGKKLLEEAYNYLNNNLKEYEEDEFYKTNEIFKLIKNVNNGLRKILESINHLDIILDNKKKRKKSIDLIKDKIENSNDTRERLISESEDSNDKIDLIDGDNSINDKNNQINLNGNKDDSDVFYDKLNLLIGNIKLIKSFAGHNGLLKQDEKDFYYGYLTKGGFIN